MRLDMPKKKGKGKKSTFPPLDSELVSAIEFLVAYAYDDQQHLTELAKALQAAVLITEWADKAQVNRHDLANAGAIPPLVSLLGVQFPEPLREQAARALCFLSFNNPIVYGGINPHLVAFDNATAIVRADGVAPLVACLSEGSVAQREAAAAVLYVVASMNATLPSMPLASAEVASSRHVCADATLQRPADTVR